MVHREVHISDEDLLKTLDGEQRARRAARIRAHLAECWSCRARSSEIEGAIHRFIYIYAISPELPPTDGSRALLKARIRDAATSEPSRLRRARFFNATRLAQAALICAFALGALWALRSSLAPARFGARSHGSGVRYIPDARFTPGATRTVARNQICSSQPTDQDHEIPIVLAQRVFREYGIDAPLPYAYEVDYLITPELGGSDDIRNLWPEPYSGSEWNAHIKDALEDRLHQMVCDGTLELGVAQRDIATDWIAAYQKYFHVDRPLPGHLAFLKDRPWE